MEWIARGGNFRTLHIFEKDDDVTCVALINFAIESI